MATWKALAKITLAVFAISSVLGMIAFAQAEPAADAVKGAVPEAGKFEGDAAAIEAGRQLYGNTCLFCHGPKGVGARAPNLVEGMFQPGRDSRVPLRLTSSARAVQEPSWAALKKCFLRIKFGRSLPTCATRAVLKPPPRKSRPVGCRAIFVKAIHCFWIGRFFACVDRQSIVSRPGGPVAPLPMRRQAAFVRLFRFDERNMAGEMKVAAVLVRCSKRLTAVPLAFAAATAVVCGNPGFAGSMTPTASKVDTALVISVDVSSSVNAQRFNLQLEGIASALEDRNVVNSILSGPEGRILVSLVSWADHPRLALPFAVIASPQDATAFAARVRTLQQQDGEFTCMGRMMRFVADDVIAKLPAKASKTIIDVSGDGPDNCNSEVLLEASRKDIITSGAPPSMVFRSGGRDGGRSRRLVQAERDWRTRRVLDAGKRIRRFCARFPAEIHCRDEPGSRYRIAIVRFA